LIVLGIAITLMTIIFASRQDPSSSNFQVGATLSPAATPEALDPTPSPTTIAEETEIPEKPEDIPDKEVPPLDDDFYQQAPINVKMELVGTTTGNYSESLGVEVDVAGSRIAMMGDGFIRVAELTPASTKKWTSWPPPPNDVTVNGYSSLKVIGNDIPIHDGKGSPHMAISSDGRNLATIVGNGQVSLYQQKPVSFVPGLEWQNIFTDWTSGDNVLLDDRHDMPTAISMSSNAITSAMIASTVNGEMLAIRMWELQDGVVEDVLMYTEEMNGEQSTGIGDLFSIEVSQTDDVIAICTRDTVAIKQRITNSEEDSMGSLQNVGGQPIIPQGIVIKSCGLSGDGLTLGLTTANPGVTIIYVYEGLALGWQQNSIIMETGTSISFGYSGAIAVVGESNTVNGSTDDEATATVWKRVSDEFPARYKLIERIPRQKGSSSGDGEPFKIAVALSKQPGSINDPLLVVGDATEADTDGAVDVYQIQPTN
jgi:hypothetical protein